MMQVRDYSHCYSDGIPKINISPLAPRWPFRLLIIGPSGSGKTNMMVDLLMNHIHYDSIWIFAKDLAEPLYMFLQQFFQMVMQDAREKIEAGVDPEEIVMVDAHFSDELSDLPDLDEIDKELQTLIIFDDFITERQQDSIKDLFIRGRKKNISSIYLTQSYFDVPKMIRLNSQYFALFNIGDKKELRSIADSHSSRVEFKDFMRVYRAAMSEPFSFLVIDKNAHHLPTHLRKGWDGLLVNI